MNVQKFLYFSLLLLFLCGPTMVWTQHFSGKITYEFTYAPKDKTTEFNALAIDMPTDSVVYTIKNGHYKSERFFKGNLIEYYTYTAASKKMYYTTEDRDYFIFFLPHDEKYKTSTYTEIHDEKDEILGYTTYKSTSVVGGEENLNFYSPAIAVDPASFEGHFFGAWYRLLKENDGAVPLRTVTNNYDHYEIKSATAITPLPLNEEDFELPDAVEIVASRESLDHPAEAKEPDQATYFCYMAKVEEIAGKMIEGKSYNFVLRIVINENGEAEHIKAINSDYLGFEKVAEQIIEECNFKFTPGKIGEQYQKAEIFMPFGF